MADHPFMLPDNPKMDFDADDLETEWDDFKEHCELVFNGSLHAQSEKVKANTLRQFLGAEGRRIFKSFTFEEGESKDKTADIFKKYDEYIAPKCNYRSARLLLQRIKQSQTERTDAFITRIRIQARKCKFSSATEMEERIIEQIIAGTKDQDVQRKLISKDEKLTLYEAIKFARNYESTQGHLADIRDNHEDSSVNAVRKSRPTRQSQPAECDYCGYPPHNSRAECPASGKQCRVCHKIGHFERKCRSKQYAEPQPPSQREPQGAQGGGLRRSRNQQP